LSLLLTTTINVRDKAMKDLHIYWKEFRMVIADNLQVNKESQGMGV